MNLAFNLLIVKIQHIQHSSICMKCPLRISLVNGTNPSLLTDSFTLNKSLDVKCIFVQSLELYIKSGYWWSTETFFCSSINVCGLISGDLRETTISNLEEEWEISNSAKNLSSTFASSYWFKSKERRFDFKTTLLNSSSPASGKNLIGCMEF